MMSALRIVVIVTTNPIDRQRMATAVSATKPMLERVPSARPNIL